MWKAHCRVGPFPTGKQGLDALKKLRELRKLHEVNWNKTNPEWGREPKKRLIRLIMDQRANSAADVAAVLSIQEKAGMEMTKIRADRKKQQEAYLDRKWREIEALAKDHEAGKVAELEKQLDENMAARETSLHDDREMRRLDKTMGGIRRKIAELRWARRKIGRAHV